VLVAAAAAAGAGALPWKVFRPGGGGSRLMLGLLATFTHQGSDMEDGKSLSCWLRQQRNDVEKHTLCGQSCYQEKSER
jgi:hypothetical protein